MSAAARLPAVAAPDHGRIPVLDIGPYLAGDAGAAAADASAIAGSCPITAVLVIPPKANRRQPIACDFHMYRWRHLVENVFCTLKAFRRIATRYDKTDESFAAVIPLAGSAIALR